MPPGTGVLRPKLLLVDDCPEFISLITPALRGKGFDIESTNNIDVAREHIKSKKFHFCVFDAYLTSVDPSKPDYEQLLKEINDEWSDNSLSDLPVNDYLKSWVVISKDKLPDSGMIGAYPAHFHLKSECIELTDWIDKCFREFSPFNWELEITSSVSDSNCNIRLSDGKIVEGSQLLEIVEEIIRLLFKKETRISIELFNQQGNSPTALFMVVPYIKEGRPRRFLIKVGEEELTKQEKLAWDNYVYDMDFPHMPIIEKYATSRIFDIGAIKYTLIGEVKTLESYYYSEEVDDTKILLVCLKKMLRLFGNNWYRSAQCKQIMAKDEIFSRYNEADTIKFFNDCFPEVARSIDTDEHIIWKEKGFEILAYNPLKYLPPHHDQVTFYFNCVAHGDLHTKNILVYESCIPIPIDFAQTNKGLPIYRDFAKLEAHVVLDLLQYPKALSYKAVSDIIIFLNWEISLNSLCLDSSTLKVTDPKFIKAANVICTLREEIQPILEQALIAKGCPFGSKELRNELNGSIRNYFHCLLFEHAWAWYWMHTFPPPNRIANLLTCSLIIERFEPKCPPITALNRTKRSTCPII